MRLTIPSEILSEFKTTLSCSIRPSKATAMPHASQSFSGGPRSTVMVFRTLWLVWRVVAKNNFPGRARQLVGSRACAAF